VSFLPRSGRKPGGGILVRPATYIEARNLVQTAVASFMVAPDTLFVETALSTICRDLSNSIAALRIV
jgi:hypothetical protein